MGPKSGVVRSSGSRLEKNVVAPPGTPRALRERAADLLVPLHSDKPAPILLCLLAWAALSALVWAGIALVIHLV
jgi:hypothetical protein